ncbi:MAG: hypothetical protein A3C38_03630 [Planctomycetes bacterium RIFCSPHIGHO2_02_FULL_50_42]|nr:MAG: hypothetical protein A2060_05210 [Planctomycetes bacterium GWA2_50_13]OHB88775.1 MAG: hypothetical protein A3C38_03630 [Planctomycetes bacterium RIFCSPHIGHO2_02_FULL_50_42]OHB92179.1 MAG: hypothetical protein A3E75_03175 [Planctomycetes bacterium RIFCSPHIGHO2_12_FULL_51_37]OHB94963.1 MAG: hypothetical protein A3I59_01565 [Planctomycetes bacterium RIFCSPLOWO2_02_FULL_50_16]OHC03054.1 MAG: hypothetical protein A3G17_00795 [Planctomycetes bacterium RIFCSPLOWO2_12_FULL_50_35]
MRHSGNGFTLIDIVIVLAVFGVLLGTMIPFTIQMVHKTRELQTLDELEKLRAAIIGDPVTVLNESRTQLGYVGDMGNLPSSLEDLYKKGSQPAYTFNTTKKTGAGWNGPYISPEIVEHLETLKTDAFGNDYDYTTTPFTDSTTGATVAGRIRSKGRDGTSDTSDDLSLSFFDSQIKSRIVGQIKDEVGEGVGGAVVTINYPSNGVLTSTTTTSDRFGFYTLDDITYGNRSITIEPKLVVVAGSADVTGANNNEIVFSVVNFSNTNIGITSYKAVYFSAPAAYYKTLIIGGVTVHDSDSNKLGSGETATFSAITIAGGTGVSDTLPTLIQSPVTTAGDIIPIGQLGRGQTKQIKMLNFRDSPTGGGQAVSMSGVPMEITFSDGSIVRFIPF